MTTYAQSMPRAAARLHVPAAHSPVTAPRDVLRRAWSGVVDFAATLSAWQERARQRRELMELDDHLLRDIGISRADAAKEAVKPFWVD